MRKKQRRKLLVAALAYAFFFQSVNLFAAASGNYTDLLPIGAAANTTVISNGSGWSLTTLPPTQTFGDALSRVETVVYQSTATAAINSTTVASTFTALLQGNVGSTTFPATWVASGRSIEVVADGTYSTPTASPSTWNWQVKLGTTTVLTTGAVSFNANQTNQPFKARAIMTIAATGNAGTVNGSYEILTASGANNNNAAWVSFSTGTTSGAVTVDLTSQLTVNPVFTWGAATSSMTIRNLSVKMLN